MCLCSPLDLARINVRLSILPFFGLDLTIDVNGDSGFSPWLARSSYKAFYLPVLLRHDADEFENLLLPLTPTSLASRPVSRFQASVLLR
jgi:hypothetical protein